MRRQLTSLVQIYGREILNMLPVSITPRNSISLKKFIGLGYFARQNGRRTVFDYWRKWPVRGYTNRFHMGFRDLPLPGFQVESFDAEPDTNLQDDQFCIYECTKNGKRQRLAGT